MNSDLQSRAMTSRVASVVGAFGFLAATSMVSVMAAAPPVAPSRALPGTIEFNRDVRPILSDKCFKCHGPGIQMKGLRLDLEEVAKQPLPDGRVAVVPGDAGKSELIHRVTATDEMVRMPRSQAGPGEPLNDSEVQV